MARQFIACTFRPGDTRAYTYAYDGAEPLAVGDIVLVAGRNGEGKKKVHVAIFGVPEPADFEAKPIIEKFAPPPADQPDLLGDDAEVDALFANKLPF
ncbi:hypothetical protein SKP52_02405 [Sphingopyxis fribergensis]|uniref:Primosomal protein N' 3' DNA-binding domain-containing protein n=2 Tax=Sphingopyxis fribergensis TaxID=1515612 RepID=A0A0A7PBD6_9SPHN|nr:hypothetical protein SKP52_02405 [Sphingopyxis fribergensis]